MVLIYHKQKRELKHKQKSAKWDQSFLNPYLNQTMTILFNSFHLIVLEAKKELSFGSNIPEEIRDLTEY